MNKAIIENLIAKNVIKPLVSNEYRLKRPLQITIRKAVIDNLKSIYVSNKEKGGIFEAVAVGMNGTLVISTFHEIANVSSKAYNYNPVADLWQRKVNEIIERGNLPFAVHTHPLVLGIEGYDDRRAKFYLKPSKPDKSIARDGITNYYAFPEAIFTKDDRLENGFGLSFFTGWIFPASITAVSTLQIASIASFIFATAFNKKTAATLSAAVFLLDFFRRPNYDLLENGDLRIKLSV